MIYLENAIGGKEMVPVQLDITIYDIPCEFVTLDIQDGHGRYEIDEHAMSKPDEEDKFPGVEKVGCAVQCTWF